MLALSRNLEKGLLAYAVAGAGLVSVALPGEAEVVYTPSNISILPPGIGQPTLTPLDLNNDGVVDFSFTNAYTVATSLQFQSLAIKPKQSGNGAATVHGQATAAAVPVGRKIGPQADFRSSRAVMAVDGYQGTHIHYSGSWLKVETAYLGLKFLINGEVHYGWARVKFPQPTGEFYLGTIDGYAYESVANQPILTGQTNGSEQRSAKPSGGATLGMLAAGTASTR